MFFAKELIRNEEDILLHRCPECDGEDPECYLCDGEGWVDGVTYEDYMVANYYGDNYKEGE